MIHSPEVQIRRLSPQARRRRRQAQRQSACCGCVLALTCLALLVIAVRGPLKAWYQRRQETKEAQQRHVVYFPIDLSTDSSWYYRYGLVRIALKIQDSQGRPLHTDEPPTILVKRNGKLVETVGGVDRLVPRPDADGLYVCRWPIPWNAELGVYSVETRYELADPDRWPWETPEEKLQRERKAGNKQSTSPRKMTGKAYCVTRASFEVRARPTPQLPVGMCVATWEESSPLGGQKIRTPSGAQGDWRAIFDWCDFIGADTLWVRAAVTKAAGAPLTMEQPFVQADLDAIPRLAAEAHRRGLKFGAWAMAYNTLPENPGSNRRKPPYMWAKDISRSTGRVSETSFISLLDRRRREHLSAFLSAMQQNPNVDYVGLDYVRTEPGYELTDLFAREMPVSLPSDWKHRSRNDRWLYVAQRAEPPGCYEHPDFYEAWNWYRAHLVSRCLREIIQTSQVTKPVWVFALSWKHGSQHGQDPLMFTDAGVSILAQMLYQIDRPGFEHVLKDWNEYIRAGQVYLACGDQVDNYWHQGLGPEEMFRRMKAAHEQFARGGYTQGAFWHDISRAAVVGNLGPYPATEWALAGAAAFSVVRDTWRVYPLSASLDAPSNVAVATPFEIQVRVRNTCPRPVKGIRIQPVTTDKVEFTQPAPKSVTQLGPGQTVSVPFVVRITALDAARKNRFMVALRVTWAAGRHGEGIRDDLPRTIVVMQYLSAQ